MGVFGEPTFLRSTYIGPLHATPKPEFGHNRTVHLWQHASGDCLYITTGAGAWRGLRSDGRIIFGVDSTVEFRSNWHLTVIVTWPTNSLPCLEGCDSGKKSSGVAACRPISTVFRAEFVVVVSHWQPSEIYHMWLHGHVQTFRQDRWQCLTHAGNTKI